MKILFISPIHADYIKKIHANLVERNAEVVTVDYPSGNSLLAKVGAVFKFLGNIRKEAKKDYDVINVHYPFIAAIAFAGLNVDTPIVTTLHGSDAIFDEIGARKKRIRKMLVPFLKQLLNKSAEVTVNTEFFKEEVVKRYGTDPEKVKVAPCVGYDERIFYPAATRTYEGPIKVGFVARLTEKKGWREFIAAYEQLRAQTDLDIEFQLVGYGADAGKVRQQVEIVNQKMGDQKLQFLGRREPETLGDFYRRLDLFAFPTQYFESFGLVGIESLACGTPVIGSDIGGIPSYLTDGDNGFLIEPKSVADLAQAVIQYSQLSPEQKEHMHQRAAESVTPYENEHVAMNLQHAFTRVTRKE